MADTREIWVDIKNYEGKYRISNLGRVKSLERQVSHDGITWIQRKHSVKSIFYAIYQILTFAHVNLYLN
ncbi:NUMOD4 domain-containing protein, partial [Bacteroides uniformis]|uniref:NUMOD4 domain-containing protein n=1 Tax=Bacteroides uniformis TaxID=820 RepID=UPI001EFFBA49